MKRLMPVWLQRQQDLACGRGARYRVNHTNYGYMYAAGAKGFPLLVCYLSTIMLGRDARD